MTSCARLQRNTACNTILHHTSHFVICVAWKLHHVFTRSVQSEVSLPRSLQLHADPMPSRVFCSAFHEQRSLTADACKQYVSDPDILPERVVAQEARGEDVPLLEDVHRGVRGGSLPGKDPSNSRQQKGSGTETPQAGRTQHPLSSKRVQMQHLRGTTGGSLHDWRGWRRSGGGNMQVSLRDGQVLPGTQRQGCAPRCTATSERGVAFSVAVADQRGREVRPTAQKLSWPAWTAGPPSHSHRRRFEDRS